jgi:hypothetical protein
LPYFVTSRGSALAAASGLSFYDDRKQYSMEDAFNGDLSTHSSKGGGGGGGGNGIFSSNNKSHSKSALVIDEDGDSNFVQGSFFSCFFDRFDKYYTSILSFLLHLISPLESLMNLRTESIHENMLLSENSVPIIGLMKDLLACDSIPLVVVACRTVSLLLKLNPCNALVLESTGTIKQILRCFVKVISIGSTTAVSCDTTNFCRTNIDRVVKLVAEISSVLQHFALITSHRDADMIFLLLGVTAMLSDSNRLSQSYVSLKDVSIEAFANKLEVSEKSSDSLLRCQNCELEPVCVECLHFG